VLLGNRDGTFQNQVTYSTGRAPLFIVTADLNNDTIQDLAVANSYGNSVSILFGKGDGTFRNQIIYAAGTAPQSMVIGAFKDGIKPDLAVANLHESFIRILFYSCS
jgi:hypothetical protein